MEANAGDHIVIESRKVGGGRKSGEVVEVIEDIGGRHYRVHWDDGHDTILYPSADAFVTSERN
ncbi:MAG: DUF1918 domain-containing protein [Acidimicrobiaceae bacterium]|nr:DUF1918 domain-containing protein [Acidimicrobiaceae bacterium]